MLTLLEDTN